MRVYTISEIDQYKFEKVVNAFLGEEWEIADIKCAIISPIGDAIKREAPLTLTITTNHPCYIGVWQAILITTSDTARSAKVIEREAIKQYLEQKEER